MEQKLKVGYIIHNTEDDVHVIHGGIKKTLSGIYDGAPIEAASSVDLSEFLSERKLPLRIDIKTQSKEVTAGTSRITVTPDEGYVLSEVQIEPTPSERKTVQAQPGEVLIVEPDDNTALLNRVTVHPVPLQHKEVTPTKSSQTIYPDTGKSFNAVSVKPIPDEYIIPAGSKQITGLGKVNVTTYAEAEIVSEDLKPEYIKKDKNILGVIGTLSPIGGTSWDDVDLSNYLRGDLYIFHAQNGIDMYIGSSASNSGIYHINKQTGVLTQIHSSGHGWQYFFEDSKGNVYVSSKGTSSSSYGILHISGTTVTQIYTSWYYWQYFFEDSKGNVYVGSNSGGNKGIIHLSGSTATQIYASGDYWQHFFEDSKGNVYVSGSSSDAGILHILDTTVTQIYASGNYWQHFFEDSKGNVYVSSSNSSTGILHLTPTTATQIYTSGYGWQYFFEDSKGNVYVGSGGNKGIIHISSTTATQIYASGNYWQHFFEDSKGNVYVSSSNSSTGLLHISDTTATQIHSSGYGWQYFFEDSKGNVYVGSSGINGILHLSGTTVTQIHSSGYYWQYFFEDSKGNVYVSSSNSSNSSSYGIIHLSNMTATKISTSGCAWQFKETDHVYAYTDQYPTPDSLCLILDGTTVYSVPIYEELLLPSNAQRVTVVPSTETQKIKPENNRTLVEVTVVGDKNLKAKNIKEGVVLYEGTDNEIVGTFEGGGSGAQIAPTLDNIEQVSTLTIDYQGAPLYCATNKKDAYLCIHTSIYHLNLETNALTKLGEGSEDVQCFFEASNGDIYASTASSASIVYVTPTSISKIYNSGSGWYNFFEDSTGNVYVGSATSDGIIRLKGATATVVYSNGNNWNAFCEGTPGNVYAGSDTNTQGIVYIPNNSTGTAIYTKSSKWCYFFQASTGVVYAGCLIEKEQTLYKTGILQLSESTTKKVYTSGYAWKYFYEDPTGDIYVSSDMTEGIIKIATDGTSSKFYSQGTHYDTYYTHSKSNYTFVTSPNIEGINILLTSNGQTGLYGVVSKGYGFKYFKEDAEGNLYVSDTYTLSPSSNIVKIFADFVSVKTIIIKED